MKFGVGLSVFARVCVDFCVKDVISVSGWGIGYLLCILFRPLEVVGYMHMFVVGIRHFRGR